MPNIKMKLSRAEKKAGVDLRDVIGTRTKSKSKRQSRPAPFLGSFTTSDACFSVEVKEPWGEVTEDVEIKIDCGGMIHGDEDLVDLLIEMLENAKENLIARRPKIASKS